MAFIVLEGLDGAGKSTQAARLQAWLRERGIEYEYLHFPRFDAPVYGDLIARFLRGEFGAADAVDPSLVALIYAGDRADAAPMIRSWLAGKKTVIVDRYVWSNVGYQCAKRQGAEREELRRWILDLEYGYNAIPRPDVSLFLDVPFEFTRRKLAEVREGDDRSYLQGGSDIHESSLTLQERVREVYLESARQDDGLHVVPCTDEAGKMASPDAIFGRIMEKVVPCFE